MRKTSTVEELEEQLEQVKAQIAIETEAERRRGVVMAAYGKLQQNIMDNLTPEERAAVSGMYLFLHVDHDGGALHVDMVRNVPSATDKGQHEKLEKMMSRAERCDAIRALRV